MIINNQKDLTRTEHIKFISYDGKYPSLCMGMLTLEIDGLPYKFGNPYTHKDKNPDFNSFWYSGGSVTANKNWDFDVSTGEWQIDIKRIPEQFKKYAREIDEIFNNNVEFGCCGGCI